jgi:hypothetical protein
MSKSSRMVWYAFWCAVGALLILKCCCDAQTPQMWWPVASEGSTQATSPSVTLPSGSQYRFGTLTAYCPAVTLAAPATLTVWYASMGCPDPAPGKVKTLYVLQGSTPTMTVNGLSFQVPPPYLELDLPLQVSIAGAQTGFAVVINGVTLGCANLALAPSGVNGVTACAVK